MQKKIKKKPNEISFKFLSEEKRKKMLMVQKRNLIEKEEICLNFYQKIKIKQKGKTQKEKQCINGKKIRTTMQRRLEA